MNWRHVFNTEHQRYHLIGNAFELAAKAGYKFMVWNDIVYNVETKQETGLYRKDLR